MRTDVMSTARAHTSPAPILLQTAPSHPPTTLSRSPPHGAFPPLRPHPAIAANRANTDNVRVLSRAQLPYSAGRPSKLWLWAYPPTTQHAPTSSPILTAATTTWRNCFLSMLLGALSVPTATFSPLNTLSLLPHGIHETFTKSYALPSMFHGTGSSGHHFHLRNLRMPVLTVFGQQSNASMSCVLRIHLNIHAPAPPPIRPT
jgi:hypothetical protein